VSIRTAAVTATSVVAAFIVLLGSAPAATAAPANDNFADAQTVGPTLPVSVPAGNVDATAETGEPAIGGNAAMSTVWFKWTAPSPGQVFVDLCGAGFTGSQSPNPFVGIAVRTGNVLNSLVLTAQVAGECKLLFQAVSGQEYKIQIDHRFSQGSFTFGMRQPSPPANDNFATPTVIGPGLPVEVNSTNVDSTWEAGEPAGLGGPSNSRSVWYSWTAPSTERVRLDFCEYTAVAGASNKAIFVYTGNTLGSLDTVTSGLTFCSMDFPVTSGVTYRIAFSGNVRGEGNFVLKLKSAPPPPNDNFADAITVGPGLPVAVDGENEFATVETGEPEHTGSGFTPARSAWYQWTPSENARVRIRTCSRDFNARVGVYTGNAVNALTQVAEFPPYSPHCSVILNAVAGTTYRIAAAGGLQDGASGAFRLEIRVLQVPGNDSFADAFTIGPALPVNVAGTTVDATTEPGEPGHNVFDGGGQGPSVWFRWTAPDSNAAVFSACSPTEPVRIAIYSGLEGAEPAIGGLKPVAGADEGCAEGTSGGKTALAPVAGRTYAIAVAPVDRDFESAFTLSATATIPRPGVTPKPKFNLQRELRRCRKIRSKKRRTACVKKARRRAAVIRCRKLDGKPAQDRCIARARKRFR
jgi:hypothetical protein